MMTAHKEHIIKKKVTLKTQVVRNYNYSCINYVRLILLLAC